MPHPRLRLSTAAMSALALLSIAAVSTSVQALTPDAALAGFRKALGVEALAETPYGLVVHGSARLFERDCRFRLAMDARGRFMQEITGPVSVRQGFDGRVAWEVDFNGTPRVLELGDRDDVLLHTWVSTGQWLLSTSGLELSSVRRDEDGIRVELRVGRGPVVGTLVADSETWRPVSLSYRRLRDWNVTYSDFADHEGLVFPGTMRTTSSAGDVVTFRVERVERVDDDAIYAPRLERPRDYRYDPEAPADLAVRRAPTGHLMVRPSIGGRQAGWFIFDTGAGSSAVDAKLARELELPRAGELSLGGVGGFVDSSLFRISEFTLGPLTLDELLLVGADFADISSAFGVRVAGVIGYDVLSRSVVEFDRSETRIALHEPSRYGRADVDWRDAILYMRVASVRATFEDHAGVFMLDTGAGGSLVVHQPVVRRLGLLDDRPTRPTTVQGIGGTLPARLGTVASLELAGQHLENVSTKFATEPEGVFGDAYTLGNIGGGILRRFTLILDYSRRRIAFARH